MAKISVFLEPKAHEWAAESAEAAGQPLAWYVSDLVRDAVASTPRVIQPPPQRKFFRVTAPNRIKASVYLDTELHAQAKAVATRYGRPLSDYVAALIDDEMGRKRTRRRIA